MVLGVARVRGSHVRLKVVVHLIALAQLVVVHVLVHVASAAANAVLFSLTSLLATALGLPRSA